MEATFPSLSVRADGISARGSFARAQAAYLDPDPESVAELASLLRRHQAGIVAHFYMDAELQGILAALDWPFVHVSDSLMMADAAVDMARRGARNIVVLGVDFMSENVRAMLDAASFGGVGVYRVSDRAIGCSLAESAETRAYAAWLEQARACARPLHVVYINTSLRTKAHAHDRVPTITCTSSNVVRTILQAAAQDPAVEIWFGPDTYMGRNLRSLLEYLAGRDDAELRHVHPAHDRASVRGLLGRFHWFEQGVCVVHHMFGRAVADRIAADYSDAHVTAHLEVPGEMFELALAAQRRGRGVVGSTADILRYVEAATRDAAAQGRPDRLSFVLGTEASMASAIVRRVREVLAAHADLDLTAEIVFPVASEAVASTDEAELRLVPGVAAGEGCSISGGCATCPYMRMNSYEATIGVLARLGAIDLSAHAPRKYEERIGDRTVAELGRVPILHMRELQKSGRLGEALLAEIDAHARALTG